MSELVGRAQHSSTAPVQNVRVDHRRSHVLMAQQFLHRSDIIPVFQQMGGKRVPQGACEKIGKPLERVPR